MEAFTTHTGTAVPLRRSNVDTDQIIPAVYLKRVTRTGFADGLFSAWRSDPSFVLNRPEHAGATILIPGPDFGTGSSREHAVWALMDYGFKVVIGSRFGDIFRNNSGKAGLLIAVIPEADVHKLQELIEGDPSLEVEVDLEQRTITVAGWTITFEIDDYTRWRLLEGLDDVALTLRHADDISAYEEKRLPFKPTTQPVPSSS
ncbi:3-isopropylmalate dehydratase small subunit [Naumannella halotolerans]|uniref:3-isopropylmalate dehydratase small subunit n=1 Tax=Naumannella halotolerans TaxID=993414 RepID=A0A4R7J7F6_9ACTN|nr:3-isopropylmalate dehydratase small subunit [Naumannella halotolerans]TDT33165.1 3-isopropylmalate/(R)-2-methylmalate dehydratase small subunit [Naumannella halotolerans]